ncbi:MAG: OmpA family protein [Cryomorphaceae bacterium]
MAHAQAPSQKAEDLFGANRYADAVKYLKKKIKRNAENAAMCEQLGFAYMKTHRYLEAEVYFERADILGGISDPGLVHYGQTLIKNSKPQEAEKKIKRYIDREPDSFVAQLMLRSIARVDEWKFSTASFELRPTNDLNSSMSEFSPFPYQDGIVFVTERNVDHITESASGYTNAPYFSMYFASIDDRETDGFGFKRSKPFLTNLNRDDNLGPIAIDTLKSRLYYTLAESKLGSSGTSHIAIHEATIVKNKRIKNSKPFLVGDTFSNAHPTLSRDGRTMIFASNRPGTTGEMDLFMIQRTDSGGWTAPSNLSALINTPLNEVFPYLKNDTTLYFSSNGHTGYGGLDLFVSNLRNGRWTEPRNLKAPINSNKDDFGLCFLNETKGLFTSSREGSEGKDDIYGFVQLANVEDSQRVEIKGLFEYANLSADGVSISLLDAYDNVLRTTQTDSLGNFSFGNLPVDEIYTVRVNDADPELLLNSNIYVVNDAGEKVQVMAKEGASTFVFTTLPKDALNSLASLSEQDTENTYDLFGQLFTSLKKDLADIELIAYTDDGSLFASAFTDSTGYYSFTDLPKSEYLTIKVNGKDSVVYKSSVFYEGENGITRLSDTTGDYFKVSIGEVMMKNAALSRKVQYTVFLNNLQGPLQGVAVALFDDRDEVLHVARTNEQGAVSIFGTMAGSPYRLLLPISMNEFDDTAEVHLIDRIANQFIDAVPSDKLNHYFEAIEVDDLLSEQELAYLAEPVPIQGQIYEILPGDYAGGLTLYAYDEDGNLIEEAQTDASGNFKFTSLRPDQNYLIKPDVEDAGAMNLIMFDDMGQPGEKLRLDQLQSYVYNTLEAERVSRLEHIEEGDASMPGLSQFVKGQIYYKLPGDYKEGIKVYAFDEDGNIVDSTYTDGKGNFTFSRLAQSEDFSIRVMDENDQALKVALYNYDGSFKGLLFLDDNMTFKYSKIILEAASELEGELAMDQSVGLFKGQIYKKLPGDYHDGLTVYAFDEDGNLIDVAEVDEEGNFQFSKLTKDQDYLFKFSEDDTEFNISLLDAEGKEFERAYATEGEWKFSKLQLDKYNMQALAAKDNGSGSNTMSDYLDAQRKPLPKMEANAFSYDFRSADLATSDEKRLDEMIEVYRENPDAILSIKSYSDPAERTGNRSYSALRSAIIAQYLHNRGVPIENMRVANWETEKPIIDCSDKPCTEEERRLNRRAQVRILDPEEVPPAPDFVFEYGFNQWKLDQNAENVAYRLLNTLQGSTVVEVKIEGFTDTWGSFSGNHRISELRAKNLQNLLISRGIDDSKISLESHGEIIPTGDCILYYPCPIKSRTQNRRVEVRLQ